MKTNESIAVLDAGGQYCHLIARKFRELGIFAEVRPAGTPSNRLREYKGIVISGGPASVYSRKRPRIDPTIFDLSLPVLGICYGHQFMARTLGGEVQRGKVAEYGIANLERVARDSIFRKLAPREPVWMSHRDVVLKPPGGFELLGRTASCPIAAMGDHRRGFYGVQFHPEVAHTHRGKEILETFAVQICHCTPKRWRLKDQLNRIYDEIQQKAQGKKVFFLVSGGVDSSVAFMLCVNALGKERVEGLYVDTGLMREVDLRDIEYLIREEGANIHVQDASAEFSGLLRFVFNPEEKRRRIGKHFVDIYEHYLRTHFRGTQDEWLLGQGTIYPDTIESGGTQHSSKIKTHHNRVSVVRKLLRQGKVIEPLNQFYKDEVRELGKLIGLSPRLVNKQPFPGPGLAVRCITAPRPRSLDSDSLISKCAAEFRVTGAKLNLFTVGVKGDERSFQNVAVVAGAITLSNLEKLSTTITNNALNINRVIYLLTGQTLELADWRVNTAALTPERVSILREADELVRRFMSKHSDLLKRIWQFPVILIPMGRIGTTRESIVLRPVESVDGMTASFSKVPKDVLFDLAELLQVKLNVDVFFDATNKPPATIEWE